jgi:hypothetical protein
MNYEEAIKAALHESTALTESFKAEIETALTCRLSNKLPVNGDKAPVAFLHNAEIVLSDRAAAKFQVLESTNLWASRMQLLGHLVHAGLDSLDNVTLHGDLCKQLFEQAVSAGQEPAAAARHVVRMCASFYRSAKAQIESDTNGVLVKGNRVDILC